MAVKRGHIDLDPDYEDVSEQQTMQKIYWKLKMVSGQKNLNEPSSSSTLCRFVCCSETSS
jgi:hypothetical protein